MALWGVDDADVLRVLELLDAGASRKVIKQQHLPHVDALALLRIVRNKDAASVQSVVERHPEWRIKQQQQQESTAQTGPIIDKVREATEIAQRMRPDLDIYGPIQYDAAVDESIAKQKLKANSTGARVGGRANVLIFPDLNTGNNTYKAVQQSTQCIAMGPMLQGLRKPVNDLSRGATVKDIVTTVVGL